MINEEIFENLIWKKKMKSLRKHLIIILNKLDVYFLSKDEKIITKFTHFTNI